MIAIAEIRGSKPLNNIFEIPFWSRPTNQPTASALMASFDISHQKHHQALREEQQQQFAISIFISHVSNQGCQNMQTFNLCCEL
jgi:hypothetical protein